MKFKNLLKTLLDNGKSKEPDYETYVPKISKNIFRDEYTSREMLLSIQKILSDEYAATQPTCDESSCLKINCFGNYNISPIVKEIFNITCGIKSKCKVYLKSKDKCVTLTDSGLDKMHEFIVDEEKKRYCERRRERANGEFVGPMSVVRISKNACMMIGPFFKYYTFCESKCVKADDIQLYTFDLKDVALEESKGQTKICINSDDTLLDVYISFENYGILLSDMPLIVLRLMLKDCGWTKTQNSNDIGHIIDDLSYRFFTGHYDDEFVKSKYFTNELDKENYNGYLKVVAKSVLDFVHRL